MAHGYLWRIEQGQVKLPSPMVLQRLAAALDPDGRGLYGELMGLAGYLAP